MKPKMFDHDRKHQLDQLPTQLQACVISAEGAVTAAMQLADKLELSDEKRAVLVSLLENALAFGVGAALESRVAVRIAKRPELLSEIQRRIENEVPVPWETN